MLKEIRISRKLSQSELARRVGISQGYLSKLENMTSRVNKINTLLIEKLAEELDVSPLVLFIYFYSPCTKVNLKCQKCMKKIFKM